ncbi:DUF459 domain-containing protein [Sutcliffiella rhizosphaerae]|uniref:Spore germination lipase LipC n=1 Tax=Sutcliffiella rhizosphaerae TaxID=2880967 RepID=A0ABM8YNL8_9BACI|nr:GDSL-type esterase/lipase family protein [Sutcliffiella rhizosphaerae]CAG9621580.1 Spore germination lipase LipC [Sutcliffiella rhizosphaerae]
MYKTIVIIAIFLSGILFVSAFYQNENPANDEVQNIVALGDSLTDGVGDKTGEGYVNNLEELLNQEKEAKVTIQNYAIRGQESDGVKKQLNLTNITQDVQQADYIILFIGTNDLLQSNGGNLSDINKSSIEAGAQKYEENLHEILSKIREENASSPILFLGLYNPYPGSEEIEHIIESWNKNSKDAVDSYQNVKFISTNDIFEEKSTKYFSDALHPNEKGYEKITERIVKEYDF